MLTGKSQPSGPTFQASFPTGTVGPRVGIFLEPLNTNGRFFFSYTTTVRYSTVIYLLVTSLRSMFTVNDARCTNQLETANKQRIKKINKWLFHQNGFTRISLSATVVLVSNFVEENVCVWCVFTSSRLPVSVDPVTQCPTQQAKYVNRYALSMFKALNKGCK